MSKKNNNNKIDVNALKKKLNNIENCLSDIDDILEKKQVIKDNPYDNFVITDKKDPLGMKNVNFSSPQAFNIKDSRFNTFKYQRKHRGFDNTELWNLDCTIYGFILPRLKAFRKINPCCPVVFNNEKGKPIYDRHGYKSSGNFSDGIVLHKHATYKVWRKMLDKMIWAIEQVVKADGGGNVYDENGNSIDWSSKEFKRKWKKIHQYLALFWNNVGALNY